MLSSGYINRSPAIVPGGPLGVGVSIGAALRVLAAFREQAVSDKMGAGSGQTNTRRMRIQRLLGKGRAVRGDELGPSHALSRPLSSWAVLPRYGIGAPRTVRRFTPHRWALLYLCTVFRIGYEYFYHETGEQWRCQGA